MDDCFIENLTKKNRNRFIRFYKIFMCKQVSTNDIYGGDLRAENLVAGL